MPPLDSAFATAFGIKSGKVDDLRAEVESNLKLELKRKVEAVLKDQAMKGLREKTQLALPTSLVDMEAVQLMRRMAANLQQQGMKAEDIKLDARHVPAAGGGTRRAGPHRRRSSCATRTCRRGPSR